MVHRESSTRFSLRFHNRVSRTVAEVGGSSSFSTSVVHSTSTPALRLCDKTSVGCDAGGRPAGLHLPPCRVAGCSGAIAVLGIHTVTAGTAPSWGRPAGLQAWLVSAAMRSAQPRTAQTAGKHPVRGTVAAQTVRPCSWHCERLQASIATLRAPRCRAAPRSDIALRLWQCVAPPGGLSRVGNACYGPRTLSGGGCG